MSVGPLCSVPKNFQCLFLHCFPTLQLLILPIVIITISLYLLPQHSVNSSGHLRNRRPLEVVPGQVSSTAETNDNKIITVLIACARVECVQGRREGSCGTHLIRVVASVRLVTSHWLHADANDRAAALCGPKVLPIVPRNVLFSVAVSVVQPVLQICCLLLLVLLLLSLLYLRAASMGTWNGCWRCRTVEICRQRHRVETQGLGPRAKLFIFKTAR